MSYRCSYLAHVKNSEPDSWFTRQMTCVLRQPLFHPCARHGSFMCKATPIWIDGLPVQTGGMIGLLIKRNLIKDLGQELIQIFIGRFLILLQQMVEG